MLAEPLSVAPSGAPDASPSVASTENISTPEVIASTAESNAAVTTPQVSEQPIESVGIQQLRTQYNALKNDLNLYKPAHELLEKHGGLERAQEVLPVAVGIYSEMIKPGDQFDAFNVADAFYQQEPDNFHKFALALPDIYPPLKAAMEQKIRTELEAQYGKQSQVPQQSENLEYDESDPYQARMAAIEQENKLYKERFAKLEEGQKQTEQQRFQQETQARVDSLVVSKLKPAIDEPLAQLTGWQETDIKTVRQHITSSLDNNEKFNELMERAVNAAQRNARGQLIDLLPEVKKLVNTQVKQSVEYFSQKFGQSVQASQALRATQEARREISTNGSGAPSPQPNTYGRPNDPRLQADLVADIERQMAGRR